MYNKCLSDQKGKKKKKERNVDNFNGRLPVLFTLEKQNLQYVCTLSLALDLMREDDANKRLDAVLSRGHWM